MTLAAYLSKRYMPPRFKHVSIAVIATSIPVFLGPAPIWEPR